MADDAPPLVGIDGYRRGWVAAVLVRDAISWSTARVDGVSDLLLPDAIVAVDMPMGLVERGLRECDALARRALRGAASRVFTTPPRAVLELGLVAPNIEVQGRSRELSGQGVSRQALGLATRILALDEAVRSCRASEVIEVHPELSFSVMCGAVLPKKHTVAGVITRMNGIRGWRPELDDVLLGCPPDVPMDDALDALASLWSAERYRDGRATVLPVGARSAPRIVT